MALLSCFLLYPKKFEKFSFVLFSYIKKAIEEIYLMHSSKLIKLLKKVHLHLIIDAGTSQQHDVLHELIE